MALCVQCVVPFISVLSGAFSNVGSMRAVYIRFCARCRTRIELVNRSSRSHLFFSPHNKRSLESAVSVFEGVISHWDISVSYLSILIVRLRCNLNYHVRFCLQTQIQLGQA